MVKSLVIHMSWAIKLQQPDLVHWNNTGTYELVFGGLISDELSKVQWSLVAVPTQGSQPEIDLHYSNNLHYSYPFIQIISTLSQSDHKTRSGP